MLAARIATIVILVLDVAYIAWGGASSTKASGISPGGARINV